MTLKDKVLDSVDPEEFYSDIFSEWKPGNNVACPFADKRHDSGADKSPSMSLSEKGKGPAFCHACGYKSSSLIGFYEDFEQISFDEACEELYNKYVQPLVPKSYIKKAHRQLLENKLILTRLKEKRGLKLEILKKYKIGWDGRLVIPIKNKYGLVVDARRYDLLKKSPPGMKVISYKEGFGAARIWPEESRKESVFFFFEGEMDTLLALQDGVPAATITSGANTWKDTWSKRFRNNHVILVPDMDKAGLSGAEKRKVSIDKFAKSVGILKLPLKGSKEENDYTDWVIDKGGSGKKLLELARTISKDSKPALVSSRYTSTLEGFESLTKNEILNMSRAESAFNYMKENGSFFRDQDGILFYALDQGGVLKINSKSERFLSFLSQKVSMLINSATSSGKFVIQHVLNRSHVESSKSKSAAWSLYDNGIIYIDAGNGKILRSENGKIEILKNAVNKEHILLESPSSLIPFTPQVDIEISEAIDLLWECVGDHMAVSTMNKYLLLCWTDLIFFKDYMRVKPLIRLMAKTAAGKSTVSKLLSILIYGEETLQHSATTKAANYALGTTHPIMIFDNIEARNMTQDLEDFMIVAATGGQKIKRKIFTDSGVITEYTRCLILTNGIEPISKHELISRTLEIDVDADRFGAKHFHEIKIFQKLKQNRGKILSGLAKLNTKYVVPRIKQGEIQRIVKEFGVHSKKRFNEAMALKTIILDALWAFRPAEEYGVPHQMVNHWLDSQSESTEIQDASTNQVLYYLETFVDRREILLDAMSKVDKGKKEVVLLATTRDLFTDFRLLARHLGARIPWENERHLGTRIVDAEEILKKAGWVRTLTMRTGRRYFKYVKKIKK